MPSIAQLLASHGCILVADASSLQVQVGLLRDGRPPVWRRSEQEAGRALFTLAAECLATAAMSLSDVRAFAFCSGPGSMLGVRTVAMALRTWQVLEPRPVYSFASLDLLARHVGTTDPRRPLSVISDARRETWNLVTLDQAATLSALMRAPTADLTAVNGPVYCSTAFRAFAPPPVATSDCTYDVAEALSLLSEADLFSPTSAPDAFQHAAPEYKRWSAQVHTAPAAPRTQSP